MANRRNQPVVPSVLNPFGSLNQVACSNFVIWLGESEQQGNMDWTKGPTPQDVTGKYVAVWEKVEGGWKLAADIWNDGK
jgi:ketosteroid isomerase-like protein